MTTTFLISEAKVRGFTNLNNSVDTELIKNCIRTAQDYRLQSIIGTVLYEKLLTDVDNNTLTGAYKTLVDDYLQDFLLYAAYYETLEEIFLRPRNNGLIKPNGGENSDPIDKNLYDTKRQSVDNKMTYYAERLTNYIIENQTELPELNESQFLYQQYPDYGNKYKSPFVLGGNYLAAEANQNGIPVYDSTRSQYPQNYWAYGKSKKLPI